MSESNPNLKAALEGVDASKRLTLMRLMGTGAFVTPVVASFAMGGLTVETIAQTANTTSSGRPIPSDRRLKTGIARVGTHPGGFGLYRFKYLWSDAEYVGVMAQEVLGVMPHAVIHGDDGFMRVDYEAIGSEMVPYAVWRGRADLVRQAVAA